MTTYDGRETRTVPLHMRINPVRLQPPLDNPPVHVTELSTFVKPERVKGFANTVMQLEAEAKAFCTYKSAYAH